MLVTCIACNRYVSMSTDGLIATLGRGCPVPEVARHTRCQQCGGHGDEIRPDWRVECEPAFSHLFPEVVITGSR